MVRPAVLSRVRAAGLLVFGSPFSANLIVERGEGKPGDWDGRIHLVWTERGSDDWIDRSWRCATRPGLPYLSQPMNPRGTGMVADGVQNRLSHQLGLHHGRAALVQVGAVRVLRDPDRDDIHEPVIPELNSGGGFNVHDVTHPNQLAGCIGLDARSMSELLDVFRTLEHYQGPRVSLTVI